jgi:hypothetical protein
MRGSGKMAGMTEMRREPRCLTGKGFQALSEGNLGSFYG